jgi:hypothetical protein
MMNRPENPTVFDARYQFNCSKTRAALMLEIRTGTPGRSPYMTDRSGALHRTMSLCQMAKLENNTSLAIPSSSFFRSYGKLALPALAWASSPLHPFITEVLAGLN